LHPERHLVLGGARSDFGVAEFLGGGAVEFAQGIEIGAGLAPVKPGGFER
jgi:hypothetical protein